MTGQVCDNCAVYGWNKVEDKSTLRCSQCKVFFYCSVECQKEHFWKVHRKYCKILAGKRTAPNAEHNAATCEACNMKNGINGCAFNNPYITPVLKASTIQMELMDGSLHIVNNPFPILGKSQTRTEQTIAMLQKILHKMLLTNHPITKTHQEQLRQLGRKLSEARIDIHNKMLSCNDENKIVGQNRSFLKTITDFVKILQVLRNPCDDIQDLWNIFNLLTGYIWNTSNMLRLESLQKVSITEYPEKYMAIVQQNNPNKYFTNLDQLLTVLMTESVSYSSMVNIWKQQFSNETQCDNCGQGYNVCAWKWGKKCCSADVCMEKMFKLYNEIDLVIGAVLAKLNMYYCDYCFKIDNVAGHRCNDCRAKFYCQKSCQRLDWKDSHKTLCEGTKKDQQKKKKGRSGRRRGGKTALAEWAVRQNGNFVRDESMKDLISKLHTELLVI